MLTLSNPSIFDITIQIIDFNDSLSGIISELLSNYLLVIVLDDYISGPYEVLFVSGSTDSVLDITIVDDNLLEPVERFNLIIDSLSGDATIGNLDNVTISIIDNDGKCVQLIVQSLYDDFAAITVQFVQSLYVIAEESRMAQLELIFSNPSYTDINVTILNEEIDATG